MVLKYQIRARWEAAPEKPSAPPGNLGQQSSAGVPLGRGFDQNSNPPSDLNFYRTKCDESYVFEQLSVSRVDWRRNYFETNLKKFENGAKLSQKCLTFRIFLKVSENIGSLLNIRPRKNSKHLLSVPGKIAKICYPSQDK